MNDAMSAQAQARSIIDKAQKVLVCINNRSSYDTHFAAAAFRKYLDATGKGSVMVSNGELILKHKRMLDQEGIECAADISGASYVITIDHAEGNIERVSYDDKEGKFRLYITPVQGTEGFNFKKVSYAEGGTAFDAIVVFGCRSLKWMDEVYEKNAEIFTTLPTININNLTGMQEYGTVKLVDEGVSVCELVSGVFETLSDKSAQSEIAGLLLRGIVEHLQPLQGNSYRVATIEKVAKLVADGADLKEAFQKLYYDHTYENFEVLRRVMNNFKYDETTGVAWSSVSAFDLTQSGVDRDTFILDGRIVFNVCSDFKVAFVLYEVRDGEIVVELESNRKNLDAKELLSEYKVAGTSSRIFFTVRQKTLAEVEESVIKAISRRVGLGGVVLTDDVVEESETSPDTSVSSPVRSLIEENLEETAEERVEEVKNVADDSQSETKPTDSTDKAAAAGKLKKKPVAVKEKPSSAPKGLVMPPPISAGEG